MGLLFLGARIDLVTVDALDDAIIVMPCRNRKVAIGTVPGRPADDRGRIGGDAELG